MWVDSSVARQVGSRPGRWHERTLTPDLGSALRRLAPLLLLSALLVMVGLPAQAQAQGRGDLLLVTTELPAMLPGEQGWVHLVWRAAGTTVEDVRVVAKGGAAEVAYPSGRGETSFPGGRTLAAEMSDYTALRVAMPVKDGKQATITLRVRYTIDGVTHEKDNLKLRIPLADASGEPYVRQTSEVAVSAGTPAWVHVFFQGVRPNDGFAVTAAGGGATVSYPSGRGDTSLARDSRLDPAERDYVALLVDPADLTEGTYALPLTVTTAEGTRTEQLTLRVTP